MSVIISKDIVREPLHVVVPLFNPWRWKSRYKHAVRAIKHFHDSGAVITLVEVGFNRREMVFADSGLDGMVPSCAVLGNDTKYRHKYIGLHSKDEIWLKEVAVRVGVQNLPYDWQNVAWIDADTLFVRSNWVGETIQKLQHGSSSDIAFCQPFSHAADLGPNYEILPVTYPHAQGVSFAKAWIDGDLKTTVTPTIIADLKKLGGDLERLLQDFMQLQIDLDGNYYGQDKAKRVFPGLALACTRNAWNAVGGLMDFAVWGGGDWHMMHCLTEKMDGCMLPQLHVNYKSMVNEWYEQCRRYVRRNLLMVEGTVLHNFHGRKVQRGYNTKHDILAQYQFDPLRHLKRDSQGLYQLADTGDESYIQLRDTMRKISRERNEDANEI